MPLEPGAELSQLRGQSKPREAGGTKERATCRDENWLVGKQGTYRAREE